MCVFEAGWFWGERKQTGWQPGMTTCCRDARTPGEPGTLFIEEDPDIDFDTEAFTLCGSCDGVGENEDGSDCDRCDGVGGLLNRSLRKEWSCSACQAASGWLDVICSGEYGSGSNVIPRQVEEHWDEGFGGPYSNVLTQAALRRWRGYSVAMVKDLAASAVAYDKAVGNV